VYKNVLSFGCNQAYSRSGTVLATYYIMSINKTYIKSYLGERERAPH